MSEVGTISDAKSPAPDTTDLPDEHLKLLDELVDGAVERKESNPVVKMLDGGGFIFRKHDLRNGSAVYIINSVLHLFPEATRPCRSERRF